MTGPTLVAVAHGTRGAAGQAQIRDLVARVADRRPGLDVRLCYVDVQQPRVGEVLPGVRRGVVVPLLLSAGYHVRVDIAEAAAGTPVRVAAPLGPDDVLLDSLTRHLPPADAVVLAAAGSSDPAWRSSVEALAGRLGGHVAYVSGSGPKVAEVVAGLRQRGARRVAIAAYLLADGLFYRALHRAGADAVTPPLCLDPAVVELVLRRYDHPSDHPAAAPDSPEGHPAAAPDVPGGSAPEGCAAAAPGRLSGSQLAGAGCGDFRTIAQSGRSRR